MMNRDAGGASLYATLSRLKRHAGPRARRRNRPNRAGNRAAVGAIGSTNDPAHGTALSQSRDGIGIRAGAVFAGVG